MSNTIVIGSSGTFVFSERGDETGTTPPMSGQTWVIGHILQPYPGIFLTNLIAWQGNENGWSVSGYTEPSHGIEPEDTIYPGGGITITPPSMFDDTTSIYAIAYANDDSNKYDALTFNLVTAPDVPPAPPVVQPQPNPNPVVNPNPPPTLLPGGCTGCYQVLVWNDVMADSYNVGYDGVVQETGITDLSYTFTGLQIGRAYQMFVEAVRTDFDPVISNIVTMTPCMPRGLVTTPSVNTGTTDCLCS